MEGHASLKPAPLLAKVAEFAAHNRPVLTSSLAPPSANYHLRELGSKALLYTGTPSLVQLLLGFNRTSAAAADWTAYQRFAPRVVMGRFGEIFDANRVAPAVPSDDVRDDGE